MNAGKVSSAVCAGVLVSIGLTVGTLRAESSAYSVSNVTIEGFFPNGMDITEDLVVRHEKFADAPVLKPAR